ncbi:hypothetical protein G4B88_000545 [Cannabis sativa]|uniref:Uncharacterized protein n=1 Tax=Cannabis sativa TaxID=3483 RepID=A0A7J6ER49_CANSA|nr:hypothetical protein G4B88_000545 [Cannabis sativa]
MMMQREQNQVYPTVRRSTMLKATQCQPWTWPSSSRGLKATIVTTSYYAQNFSKTIEKSRAFLGTQVKVLTIKIPCSDVGLPEGIKSVHMVSSPENKLKFFEACEEDNLGFRYQPTAKPLAFNNNSGSNSDVVPMMSSSRPNRYPSHPITKVEADSEASALRDEFDMLQEDNEIILNKVLYSESPYK